MSRAGTSTTPNARRHRKMVTITLSPAALRHLDTEATRRGETRSRMVELLILVVYLDDQHRIYDLESQLDAAMRRAEAAEMARDPSAYVKDGPRKR